MVVVFYHPHNEGTVFGLITGTGFDTGTALVDGYEVDATIKSFDTEDEAREYLIDEHDADLSMLESVAGGYLAVEE